MEKLTDVKKAFEQLPEKYSNTEVFEGGGSVSSLEDHIQGFVHTPHSAIFMVNQNDRDMGSLFVYDIGSKKLSQS